MLRPESIQSNLDSRFCGNDVSEWIGWFFCFDKRTQKTITNHILFLRAFMDFQIIHFINSFWHWSRLDVFSQYISRNRTMIGIRTIVIILAIVFKRKYRKFVLFSFMLAWILFYGVSEIGFKTLLTQETGIRPRPYVTYSWTIQAIGKQYSDSSFPSSHMVLTVAMITVLIILFPAVRPYAILYALLMMWSRMHNGMHYPSDVLAGAFFWILCGWIAVVLSRRVFPAK